MTSGMCAPSLCHVPDLPSCVFKLPVGWLSSTRPIATATSLIVRGFIQPGGRRREAFRPGLSLRKLLSQHRHIETEKFESGVAINPAMQRIGLKDDHILRLVGD